MADAEMIAAMQRIDLLNATLTEAIANYDEALDTCWILVCAAMVFFMHAGFTMLETGCVQLKNTQNILCKNCLVVVIATICWYAFGYGLAYGAPNSDSGSFAGTDRFFGSGFIDEQNAGVNRWRDWFFQWAFCATCATIVSGAMAERTGLIGFAIYVAAMTTFVYPVVVHWTWGGGWLADRETPYSDFAGSGIVHMCGGVGALVGAAVVGPRAGRFDANVDQEKFVPHNVPIVVLGTFILFFGWFGFNPGSSLAMKTTADAYSASMVAMNTTVGGAMGGLVTYVLAFVLTKKHSVGALCNGILAGLVGITAGCGSVEPGEAFVIGGIGGLFYLAGSMLTQAVKVDDPIEAFAVHGCAGFWGVLAVGLFGGEATGGNGIFHGGENSGAQLGVQVLGALMITLWSGGFALLFFVPLKMAGLLRVSDAMQNLGLDEAKHSPRRAYTMDEEAKPSS
mmetsp:Transcript_15697/g.37874  ORF Transcript_15697/g.37874 Transcript_15697/m.37874 type:complete len:452 (+) Transcript_15697:34-1389(+)